VDRPAAISTRGLTKRYGPILGLDAVGLEIPAGTITGVIGPNGSGRTTLLRLLAGLIRPTAGSAVVAGVPVGVRRGVELRRRIGVLPAADAIYDWMTGREQVAFAAELAGIARTEIPDRVDDTLHRVGLGAVADARTAVYDLAQRRRLGLAQALIGEPEVVFLDEPVTSLEPATRTALLGIIRGLRDQATVLLTTADPSDVEAVCDRVAVLEGGRLLVSARVDDLVRDAMGTNYVITLDGQAGLAHEGLLARLGHEPWVRTVEANGLDLRVSVRDEERAARELLPAIVATGLPIASFRRERPTLGDVIADLPRDRPQDAGSAT